MEASCFAPRSSSSATVALCPFSTAACSAVAPLARSVFFAEYKPPAPNGSAAPGTETAFEKIARGISKFTSAPASSSAAAARVKPRCAARYSGAVSPLSSTEWSALHGGASRARTARGWSQSAAVCSGVPPVVLRALESAPAVHSACITPTCPISAAK